MSKKPRRKYHARAMDKMSARVMDVNGYMSIQGNPISKEGVFDYLGSQLPGAVPEDANRLFKVYRPAEELQKPETLHSFKLMPFIDEHNWLGAEGSDPGAFPMTGSTGEQVYFEAPYLKSNLRIYSQLLMSAFNQGKVELSPAYRYIIDWTPGVWNGIQYDCVQRELRGNHLALVKTGRTGPDVAVMDSAPTGDRKMTLEELIAAIKNLPPEQLAALMAAINYTADDDGAVAEAAPEDVPAEAAALDAPTGEDLPAVATDAEAPAVKEPAKAQDAAIAALTRQVAALTKMVGKGMDSGAVVQQVVKAMDQRNELASRLSTHIGAFACDSMTLDQVAAYGIKKLNLTAAKGAELATINGYLQARTATPQIVSFAQDSAPNTSSAAKAIDEL